MFHKKLALGLIALALSAPFAQAQTAAPAPVTAGANAVDYGSISALKEMGNYLQTLQRFQVATQLTGENVLEDGQKLQHSASATLQVQRPNKVRALMSSSRSTRELVYDGKQVTIYTPALKYYGTVAAADTIAGMIPQLETRYGIEIPLDDLFIWGTPAAPIDKIESAMNAGQDFVGTTLCDHYAFRQGQIDWQIWISVGDTPLPRKIVITDRSDEARPQSVSYLDWNVKPTFKDDVFKFTPPKGSHAITIRPLDAK